jgi:hypothetical protein
MLTQTQDSEEIIERVAALDIGKAEVMCCVRVPDEDHPDKRLQEVTPYSTMTRSLLLLADRLAGLGVTRVVMESTSDYWKPVCSTCWRPTGLTRGWPKTSSTCPVGVKTDRLDAVWLCKVAERGDDPPEFRAPAPDPPPAGSHAVPP